jgi:hypothetical protein
MVNELKINLIITLKRKREAMASPSWRERLARA